jgi:hypothetical protein
MPEDQLPFLPQKNNNSQYMNDQNPVENVENIPVTRPYNWNTNQQKPVYPKMQYNPARQRLNVQPVQKPKFKPKSLKDRDTFCSNLFGR